MRDVEFAKGFVRRHQNKLLFGSDCPCKTGVGPSCISATKLNALAQLDLDATTRTKILQGNARKVLKLKT
jgi:predicted TIM-barrel fold metal-dependent hydrolase